MDGRIGGRQPSSRAARGRVCDRGVACTAWWDVGAADGRWLEAGLRRWPLVRRRRRYSSCGSRGFLGQLRHGEVHAGGVRSRAGCVAPGAAVEPQAPAAAGLTLVGVAPPARDAESVGPVRWRRRPRGRHERAGSGRVRRGRPAGCTIRWRRGGLRSSGCGPPLVICRCVEGAAVPVATACRAADQFGPPGGRVVRVGGRSGVGVPVEAVAPVGAPLAGDVHWQDRVRGVEDVSPYRLADVPAVGGGEGHVAEQLVPLGDLVTGLARAGADGAGVEAADVGEDGGDFASVQGWLTPFRSVRRGRRAGRPCAPRRGSCRLRCGRCRRAGRRGSGGRGRGCAPGRSTRASRQPRRRRCAVPTIAR